MALTAVNIKLVAFCDVSLYGVAGATVLKGFVALILTVETEVAKFPRKVRTCRQLHGVLSDKSQVKILFGSKTSLYLERIVLETVQLCMNCRLYYATFLWLFVHWCFFEVYRDTTNSPVLRDRAARDIEIFTSDLYET